MSEVKHLKDLFSAGHTVSISAISSDGEAVEFPVWIAKINAREHEKIVDACRAAQVRRRRYVESEMAEAMDDQVDVPADEIIDTLLAFQKEDIRKAAYEEVLHNSEIGSDWSEEGYDLIGLAAAISVRSEEISKHNEDKPDEKILPEEDEELARLTSLQDKFFDEVSVLIDEKKAIEKAKMKTFSVDELRDKLRQQLIMLETHSAWYDEFKRQIVFRSTYYDNDRRIRYFSNIDEIDQLPDYVFDQLWEGYDENSFNAGELKK